MFLALAWGLAGCAAAATPSPTPEVPFVETATAGATGTPLPVTPTRSAHRPSMPATPTAAPVPALPERRRVHLDYPARLRVGDGDGVVLTIEVDAQGNLTPTVSAEGHTVTGQVIEIPNLYETHTVQAEARLDVAGLQIAPPGEMIETLQPGQKATFRWSVRATEDGVYRGTVSLHLRFLPKNGGEMQRMAVGVLPLTIDARTLAGLDGHWARLLGWIGSLLGSVFSLGDLLPWLLKRLERREG